jgi:hypothetical protein
MACSTNDLNQELKKKYKKLKNLSKEALIDMILFEKY